VKLYLGCGNDKKKGYINCDISPSVISGKATNVLKFNGERVVIGSTPQHIEYEHLERYAYAKKFVKNKIVLDIACGTGYGSAKLSEYGAKKVIAGDIFSNAIKYAKKNYKRNNVEFKILDCEKINLPNNSIDIVISFETIEHIPNYIKFIQEVKRVLKQNGTFICSSPNKKITSPFTKNPLNSFHVKEFKIEELSKILDKEGFEILKIIGQSFVNNNLKFKIKNFIRSYFGFTAKFYKMFLKSTTCFESAKNVNNISNILNSKLEPTYFILVTKKK